MTNKALQCMQYEDVLHVVEVHLCTFQGFFLSVLGTAFLCELYSAILADPSGLAFVITENQKLIGFVAGTDYASGFYRRLLRQRWWRFVWASIFPALRNPRIIPRLFRAFSMPQTSTTSEGCGTLMSIAVLPEYQGKGIGKELIKAYLAASKTRGLTQVNLTTDKLNNDPINKFYSDLGFSCIRSYTTPEGRVMNEYLIHL